MDLVALDDDLLLDAGQGEADDDADEFSSDSHDEPPLGAVDVVLAAKPARKKRRTASPAARSRAALVHRALLLVGVATALHCDSRANDEECRARALSVVLRQGASVASSLRAVWRCTGDMAVCVAWVRDVLGQRCRVVAALPYVTWKPVEEEALLESLDADEVHWACERWCDGAWVREWPTGETEAKDHLQDVLPLCYVVAVGNGRVLDITPRYARVWSKTCKRRNKASEEWWVQTLRLLSSGPTHDDNDDDDPPPPWVQWDVTATREALLAEPIPTSVSGIRAHPTYVRKDHVSRYFSLLPDAEEVGRHDGVGVYLRSDVVPVHSIDKWTEQGMELREGEVGQPAKRVESRSKVGHNTLLYGPWQVKDMDVGEAVEGVVPKVRVALFQMFRWNSHAQNTHGNVYLYRPGMMPRGCVLLDCPGLSLNLTRKLGIDAAKAVVAFTFKRGASYPQYASGLVVAMENVEVLQMACAEQAQLESKRAAQREEKKIRKLWRRLVRRALVWQRLNNRFDHAE